MGAACQGVGHRDEGDTRIIEPGDETGELALVLIELVPKRTTQTEIVAEGCLQGAHWTINQGRANSPSAA